MLDGLKLRLEDLAAALNEIQGRPKPVPITNEDFVLGFPREEVERVFREMINKINEETRKREEEEARPKPKPRKARKD